MYPSSSLSPPSLPPPPTTQEGYVYTPPPPRGPELSLLQHETETEYTTADRARSFFLNNIGIAPHPRSYFNIKF